MYNTMEKEGSVNTMWGNFINGILKSYSSEGKTNFLQNIKMKSYDWRICLGIVADQFFLSNSMFKTIFLCIFGLNLAFKQPPPNRTTVPPLVNSAPTLPVKLHTPPPRGGTALIEKHYFKDCKNIWRPQP